MLIITSLRNPDIECFDFSLRVDCLTAVGGGAVAVTVAVGSVLFFGNVDQVGDEASRRHLVLGRVDHAADARQKLDRVRTRLRLRRPHNVPHSQHFYNGISMSIILLKKNRLLNCEEILFTVP